LVALYNLSFVGLIIFFALFSIDDSNEKNQSLHCFQHNAEQFFWFDDYIFCWHPCASFVSSSGTGIETLSNTTLFLGIAAVVYAVVSRYWGATPKIPAFLTRFICKFANCLLLCIAAGC